MTTPTRKDLAKILATLPYGVLAQVAKELVEMNAEESGCNRHPETAHGMAETLYDWGEAYMHDEASQ
jgi:hypothetical protein